MSTGKNGVSGKILKAIEESPSGIASLDVLKSLRLTDPSTLKTTLSRLNQSERIIRLKRGVYSSKPIRDAYCCAQALFNGYVGFAGALHVHKIITEIPFMVVVVTSATSKTRVFNDFEFKAVALKEKAIGFERVGNYVVSTRAKTLFDCLYLPDYSIEVEKLCSAFAQAGLSKKEWVEFESYVEKFVRGKTRERMLKVERKIKRGY